MRWRIRRIVNGCAAQQLVACRDVIAPEYIFYGLVIHVINRKVYLKKVNSPLLTQTAPGKRSRAGTYSTGPPDTR